MAKYCCTVKFPLIQGKKVYMCRKCRTHIALVREDDIALGETRSINLQTAVNLMNSTPEYYVATGRTEMTYMTCIKCKTALGWKYVEVESPTKLMKKGRVILYLDRLLLWSGEKME